MNPTPNPAPVEEALGLSARLATRAMTFDAKRLSPSVIHATQRAILDGIGVMLAASGESPEVRPFFEWARSQAGPPHATVLGFDIRLGAAQAALVNGALAHALDYEDAFDPAPLHPNASLLPAALAAAECRSCSGMEFLAAVALGCDFACRLGLSIRQPLEAGGWYPPPIIGAFGATLAAARLTGLDSRQLCDAWSLLLTQNSCPGEIKYSPESVLRAVREAFPAHAAVLSVQLAARGVRGFDAPLEGKAAFYALFAAGAYEPAALLSDFGERFWIEQLSFKRWPCCRGTHPYIEAARALREQHRFGPEDIAQVLCTGGSLQEMLFEPREQKLRPQTIIDAKFSIPFTVALALTQDDVTLSSFNQTTLRDTTLLELAAICTFQRDTRAQPTPAASGELALRLRDGRTVSHSIAHALGESTRPLSDSVLRGKFIDCASRAAKPVAPARANQYADVIFALDREPDAAAALRRIGST